MGLAIISRGVSVRPKDIEEEQADAEQKNKKCPKRSAQPEMAGVHYSRST